MQMQNRGALAAPDGYLPARLVWERYSITPMTLWRWSADDSFGFPKPTYFGRFRYFKLHELVDWEASQPRSASPIEALADGRRRKAAAAQPLVHNARGPHEQLLKADKNAKGHFRDQTGAGERAS